MSIQPLVHDLISNPDWEMSINIRREWQDPDCATTPSEDSKCPTTLSVSFERTVRVSDNDSENDLPTSLGSFPLYKTSDYKKTLSPPMAAKGGHFLPIYRMFCEDSCRWREFSLRRAGLRDRADTRQTLQASL